MGPSEVTSFSYRTSSSQTSRTSRPPSRPPSRPNGPRPQRLSSRPFTQEEDAGRLIEVKTLEEPERRAETAAPRYNPTPAGSMLSYNPVWAATAPELRMSRSLFERIGDGLMKVVPPSYNPAWAKTMPDLRSPDLRAQSRS